MKRAILVSFCVLTVAVSVGAADLDEIHAEKGEVQIEDGRGLDTSVLVVESVDDTDPAAVVIAFTGENASTDYEYWDRVTVELPTGWSIVSMDVEEVEVGSLYEVPTMAGAGTNVATWSKSDAPCSGLGFLRSADANDVARFIVTVDTAGVAGTVDVTYMIEGDSWGGDPHVVCSTTSACAYDSCNDPTTPASTTDLSVTIAQPPTPTPQVMEAIPTNTKTGLVVLIGIIMLGGVLVLSRRS